MCSQEVYSQVRKTHGRTQGNTPAAGGMGWGDIGGPGKNPGGRGGCTLSVRSDSQKEIALADVEGRAGFCQADKSISSRRKSRQPRVMEQHGVCREAAIPWKAGSMLARMVTWDFELDLGDAGKSLIKGRQHSDVVTFVQLEACLRV